MNSQNREKYLWLQEITLLLQGDYWPLEISKNQALAVIIEIVQNSKYSKSLKDEAQRQRLELDFSNPKEFLANLYKIAGALSQKNGPLQRKMAL